MGVVVAEAGNEGWCACTSIALVYFGMVCAYLCWYTCTYIYWTCIICIMHRHKNQGAQGFLTPSLLASSGQIYVCIACFAVHRLYVCRTFQFPHLCERSYGPVMLEYCLWKFRNLPFILCRSRSRSPQRHDRY